MKKNKNIDVSDKFEKIDNFCEECKKKDKSVSQNLILTGFKICNLAEFLKLYFQFN
tara:strand:+ start:38 stop:205 length:168 start_codon:yes stop_codon:yes gene_type:complete